MNILIVRFSSLGDLVTLEPVFRTYRHFFKASNITFLSSSIGRDLYCDSKYFDEIITHATFVQTIKKLKEKHYDIVINLQCSSLSHWITLLINKDRLINQSSSMLTKYLHIKTKIKTQVDILFGLGFNEHDMNMYFKSVTNISLPYEPKLYSWQKDTKITVALAPGASDRWVSKKWGDSRYSELAKILLKNGYTVILIGSRPEEDAGRLIETNNPKVLNLISKTSIQELKSILASTNLIIGNDSGPAHIAAGVGINTITIFGSTDRKHCVKYEPKKYKGHHICLYPKNLGCHPCYKTKCPTKQECMSTTNPEFVYKEVLKLLEHKNE